MPRMNSIDEARRSAPKRRSGAVSGGRPEPDAFEEGQTFSLRDKAYRAIKGRIIRCVYKPGEYMNENRLCMELGLGHTPVHQAVSQLQLEGMIDVIPRKGLIVKPVSMDDIRNVAEARMVNEVECVRLASERITPEDLEKLEAILRESDQAREARDIEQLMRLDRKFHATLARASRNPVLADFLGTIHDRSLRVWFISLNNPAHLQEVQSEHARIVAGLRQSNAPAALAAMRDHMQASLNRFVNHTLMIEDNKP